MLVIMVRLWHLHLCMEMADNSDKQSVDCRSIMAIEMGRTVPTRNK